MDLDPDKQENHLIFPLRGRFCLTGFRVCRSVFVQQCVVSLIRRALLCIMPPCAEGLFVQNGASVFTGSVSMTAMAGQDAAHL